MTTLLRSGVLVLLLGACAAPADPPATMEADFDDAVTNLQMEYGGDGSGKADLFGVDPCDVLRPILSASDASIRSGFFMGVEGEAALAGVTGIAGFDMVFDLYHHQMSVSKYLGAGVATQLASASIEGYVGFATGFEHGVSDWDGYFLSANLELGLPFLQDFVSVNPSVFVTGSDWDEDGFVGPDEIVVPPGGVYGFTIGVELGVAVPTGLPASASVTEGLWEPHREAIRWYYDQLADVRIFHVGSRLVVRLVDHETGEECDPNWPDVGAEQECVIEFGDPTTSHTRRGLHTAYGLCDVTGGCGLPLSWPLSAAAIGIGAARDAGDELSERCPDLAPALEHR